MKNSEAFPCPKCGKRESEVIDSRGTRHYIRRRRRCIECGQRWSTEERAIGYRDELLAAIKQIEDLAYRARK